MLRWVYVLKGGVKKEFIMLLNAIECFCVSGLNKIEFLQSHQNIEIYQKAFDMIERYFGSEEEDTRVVPTIDAQGQQFQFRAPDSSQLPVQGFEF